VQKTERANQEVFRRLCNCEPVLVAIAPAGEAVRGFPRNGVLTSGPALHWDDYAGGQRAAILGGAIFEGLARNDAEADLLIRSGKIQVAPCSAYACVGSLAGIYTASMPVFVVKERSTGRTAYCNIYEGTNPRRLNYGVYDEGVKERLLFIQDVVAPVLSEAVRLSGGIALKPIMQRALHMGDELHSRNTAAALIFTRELFPHLLRVAATKPLETEAALTALTADHYFFLRLSMAAAKLTADSAHGIAYSSIVTAMLFNCREFAIRVSGLGDQFFTGPLPTTQAKLFEGHSADEITWMGGESVMIETVGLGALAQAAAFPLQAYQGGSPEAMIKNNLEMYEIVVGDNETFKIPFFRYRGTPTGIDVRKVVQTGITPFMDIGIAGKGGGQIGAGNVRADIGCFEQAHAAMRAWL
jgi:hypothetical protein